MPITFQAYPFTSEIIYPGITFQAYPLTPEITHPVYGGSGAPGFIKLTYLDIEELLYSLSVAPGYDQYGNQLPVGYQGLIYAQEPGGGLAVTETWHSLDLTNASGSGNGVNGFYYRLSTENEVELIWDFTVSSNNAPVAILPKYYYPVFQQNVNSGWYGTGPTSYSDTFQPRLNVNGSKDALPGQIYYYGNDSKDISYFGRAKITLDA
jgi:hypothetical protein